MCAKTHARRHAQACVHTHVNAHSNTHTTTHTKTHTNTNRNTHTHTPTRTHTHPHTYLEWPHSQTRQQETLGFPWHQQQRKQTATFWGPNITKTKGPTAGTFSRDQRGVFVGHRPPWSPVAPRQVFIVRDPGRHTHTKPRWGGHEPHRGNSTRGRQKPRGNSNIFSKTKTGRTKPSRGNSTRGPPKTRSNSKRFSRTKNPSTQKATQREFHQGTAKNPAATATDFQRRKNPSTHQGIA